MMPDDIAAPAYGDGKRADAHALHGYQLSWMSSWKKAASNRLTVGSKLKELKEGNDSEQRDLIGRSEVVMDSSTYTGTSEEVARATKDALLVNEVETGKSKKASCDSKLLDNDVLLNGAGSCLPSASAHNALPETETSVKEGQLLSQGVPMKSLSAVEQKDLVVSTPVLNGFVKSASDLVPTNGRDKDLPKKKRITKCHSSASLSRCIQGEIAHFPHNLVAAGSDDGLNFVHGQHKAQSFSADPNIKNQIALLESTKPQNFNGVSCSVAQVPCSVHDMETMKTYTGIDSVEKSLRVHPKVSKTTHHIRMSKKTDVNLSSNGQFCTESELPAKLKGNTFNEILDLSPPNTDHAVEGPKLKILDSSRRIEGEENIHDFKCPVSPTNESSAETDTMDIDALREVPYVTNKCSKDSQNSPTSQVAITTARRKTIVKSVNINKEPDEVLPLASPVDDRETSPSKTHSLDVEQLFSDAGRPVRSKSSSSSLGLDPSSRRVKRLKLCTSDSAHGTKSEKIGETSSHGKTSNISSNNMEDNKTSLEAKMLCHAEEQIVPNPPAAAAAVLSNDESSFTNAKKTVDITLSHPWIQRWSHNLSACSEKRRESAVFREPKSSNTKLEEPQKKQLPSIAAMAMMGKAVKFFNPSSELIRKGRVMVWNTKGV